METLLCQPEQVRELLPQREPILMVDSLYSHSEQGCTAGLRIKKDNLFCLGGLFIAEGIIEHIAQSASLYMGYQSHQKEQGVAIGYLGEVKSFELFSSPRVGDQLVTSITIISYVMRIMLIAAETRCNGQLVATCRMKIST